jgi:hypothetical protein
MNNFSAISWREQVIFDEMMKYVSFVLNQHAWFDFASSLKQQSAARNNPDQYLCLCYSVRNVWNKNKKRTFPVIK